MSLNEPIAEGAALEWFGELGYAVGHRPPLAPDEPVAERNSFGDVVLVQRGLDRAGAMTHTMSPLIGQLIANRKQSRTLANLRDTLLPKLLISELRIRTSEAALEALA